MVWARFGENRYSSYLSSLSTILFLIGLSELLRVILTPQIGNGRSLNHKNLPGFFLLVVVEVAEKLLIISID